jgi:hypothetical protein
MTAVVTAQRHGDHSVADVATVVRPSPDGHQDRVNS